jgi:hypothetical protein
LSFNCFDVSGMVFVSYHLYEDMLKLWLLLLPATGCGQILHFGTNQVMPGRIVEFAAPFNARAKAEAALNGRATGAARGAIVVPPGFDPRKACPVFIVNVPSGGSAISSLRSYTNVVLEEGWMLLAADGPKMPAEQDTVEWGWCVLGSVLEQFTKHWPHAKQWPMAPGGFSGGAKRAGAVAAGMMREGYRVTGIFMGGCNEDRASLGVKMFQPPAHFRSIPIFLSNGSSDPIANPTHAAKVKASMDLNRFTRVRLETYEGGHRLYDEHVREALRWFRGPASLGK